MSEQVRPGRQWLAPPDSGTVSTPDVCKHCGASMRGGRHSLRTLDANHDAEARRR